MEYWGKPVHCPRKYTKAIGNAHHDEVSEPVITFDTQTMQIRAKFKSETNTTARHNTFKANWADLKRMKLSVITNATFKETGYTGNLDATGNINPDPTAGTPNSHEMVTTTSCTRKTCVQRTMTSTLKGRDIYHLQLTKFWGTQKSKCCNEQRTFFELLTDGSPMKKARKN